MTIPRSVLQIVSLGHSGSTVTDMAVGSHPEAFSTGELLHLPARYTTRRCTCGQAVDECPVWSQVASHFEERSDRPLTDADLSSSPTDVKVLFDSLFTVTGARLIVDSSKDLGRALRVRAALEPEVDVTLLHLVRDVRGWARSQRAANERHKAEKGPRPVDAESLGRRWKNHQLAAVRKGNAGGRRMIRLRYEDLCRDPAGTIRRIERTVGLEESGFDGNLAGEFHLFEGNRTRWTSARITALEEPWRGSGADGRLGTYGFRAAVVARYLGYR